MNTREIAMALAAADPVDRGRLDGLDLEAMEAELLADLDGEQPAPAQPGTGTPRRPHRGRRLAFALGAATLAAAVAVLVVLPGSSDQPSRAYGAELVRFAESTPLLLLEGPGWRVQNVYQQGNGEGSMEFVTGKPVPYETIWITGNDETGQRQSGMFPAAVRQRKVDLAWRPGTLESSLSTARGMPHPHGRRWTKAPVLGTTADVDTRAEFFVNQGGPGNRQMTAFWSEGGNVLELRAAVRDLAAFEERLDWLSRVDSQTWLDAMPEKVVKAADHDAAVREMLKEIPVTGTFKASQVPDEGLTTNRYQVGAAVTGTVTCLWFRQWGEARRTGDRGAAAEAEEAMATAKRWPILHEMAKDGAYPELVWQLAAAMPSGEWPPRGWRLLPHAEGLGCARHGIPVLPWKQRLQRERRDAEATAIRPQPGPE
jgi:hypothetical protein